MAVILSLDIGTSKVCSLALSLKTLKPMAVHSMANAADVADLAEGRYEQNPRRIREGCLELLARVCRDPAVNSDEVVGIGVTGQMHGVLLVDGTLEPLTNLITWRDQRALETDLSLIRPDADDLSRCGCGLHAGYGGATLHWLGKGELIPAGARALTIADFVVSSLTGEIATEPTHAASWGLYNLGTNDWDDIMVERLGLSRDVLAPVIATATRQGGLTQRCANALGLAADTPVCASMGDNQASVIGAAGFAERTAVLNLGTGGQISIPRDDCATFVGLETRLMPFGRCILVGASLCGGWSYAYLKQFFQEVVRNFTGQELADADVYEVMNELADDQVNALRVDTRFTGTRYEPSVRGTIGGIDGHNLTPGQLVYAFAEGMVRELAEMVPAEILADIDVIAAGGNAVRKNPLVRGLIEKDFGRGCRITAPREEAALGAAYAAGVGLALVQPERVNKVVERGE